MSQFSNVTYTGSFSGSGSGSDNGFPGTAAINGSVTATITESASGAVSGTYTYSYSSKLTPNDHNLPPEGGPSGSGGGTISGTASNIHFTPTSGPLASGTGSLNSAGNTVTFSAHWTFSGNPSGSGSASGSMHGSPPSNSSSGGDIGDETVKVAAGQTFSGTTVVSGGVLIVLSGGETKKTIIKSAGTEVVSFGAMGSGTTVSSGGTQIVWGETPVTQVSAGGLDLIESGGTDSSSFFIDGELHILSGGTAIEEHMLGGLLMISDAADDFDSIMSAGAQEFIGAGGLDGGSTFEDGGVGVVQGVADSSTLKSGGTEIVSSDGTAEFTEIFSHSLEIISTSGETISGTIHLGGLLQVSFGTASAVTILSGGTEIVGGKDVGAQIDKGGKQFILGGTAVSATVSGLQTVGGTGSAGTAISAQVDGGGTQYVSGGGTAKATTVESGGSQIVGPGGNASGTVMSGGVQLVYGDASGTVVFGGTEVVESGGTVSSTIVSGGTEIVSAHGSDLGVKIGNGIVDIQNGGNSESVTFLGGGTGGLELADTSNVPSAFTGVVSGFGQNTAQFIELVSVTSNASVSLSYTSATDVLAVLSAGHVVADIALAGSYSSSSFQLTAGSGHHVEIIDPPVGAGPPTSGPTATPSAALFGGYIAASFVSASDAQGVVSVADASAVVHSPLASPHGG